jgi:hypothetical protein
MLLCNGADIGCVGSIDNITERESGQTSCGWRIDTSPMILRVPRPSPARIRHDVAFCKEVAERIGLGCELPSKNAAVGPNGPKIKSEPVLGMVQVFDSREINGRDEWI